jgi:hypothetical protein
MFNALQNAAAGREATGANSPRSAAARIVSRYGAAAQRAQKRPRDSLFPCGLCKSICRGAQTEKGNSILEHISKLAVSERVNDLRGQDSIGHAVYILNCACFLTLPTVRP